MFYRNSWRNKHNLLAARVFGIATEIAGGWPRLARHAGAGCLRVPCGDGAWRAIGARLAESGRGSGRLEVAAIQTMECIGFPMIS